jgi:hypothetical protein
MSFRRNAGLRLVDAKTSFLAAILACTLLANVVPLSLAIQAEMCAMSCCATRGPHSAASHCTDNVCHLNHTAPASSELIQPDPHFPEPLAVTNGPVIVSPCPRSCGAVAGYSLKRHRQSEPATPAELPSSNKLSACTSFGFAILANHLQRRFPPRAPPSTLS